MGSVARKDGYKQAAQARRLLANITIAPHVVDATIVDARFAGRDVVLCRAHEPMMVGRAVIENGKQFYLVASKFSGRHYIAIYRNGEWQCSSREETTIKRVVAKAEAYRQELARHLEEERLAKATTFAALREQHDVRAQETRIAKVVANYLHCDAQAEEELEEARFKVWAASFRIEKRDATSRYSRDFFVYWYVQHCDDQSRWHDILDADGCGYLLAGTEAGARHCLKEEYGIEDVVVIERPIPPRQYLPMVGGNTCWHELQISA